MDQVKFVEDKPLKKFEVILSAYFTFFKGCLPQILIGPFLNTLTQINCLLLLDNESILGELFFDDNDVTYWTRASKLPLTMERLEKSNVLDDFIYSPNQPSLWKSFSIITGTIHLRNL